MLERPGRSPPRGRTSGRRGPDGDKTECGLHLSPAGTSADPPANIASSTAWGEFIGRHAPSQPSRMLAGVPGSLRFVRVGTPAFDALAGSVDAFQRGDPSAAVTVVAPSARAARALRHRLAARIRPGGARGLVNVRFLVLADLAAEIGGPACRREGRRPLGRAALGSAARSALRDHPAFLAAVAEHPSTEQELVDVYKEVRQLGAVGLARLASASPRGADLSVLCASMRERLRERWFDDVDLVDAAVDEIRSGRSGRGWDRLVIHLPERMRPAEVRLLGAVAEASEVEVQLGVVSDGAADAPSRRLGETLAGEGFAVVGPALLAATEADPDSPIGAQDSLVAPDAESETRAAVRLVLEHLAAGGAPERVALLFASRDPYLRLIATTLGEAGIAWNGPSPDRVADSSTARFLFGLLDLAISGLERAAVMAWLRSVPIRQGDGTATPVGDWERVSRLSGIVGGTAAEWRRHLDALAEESRRALGEESLLGGPECSVSSRTRLERSERVLAASVKLQAFVEELDATCRAAAELRSWSGFVEWSRAVLTRYLGGRDEPLASDETDDRLGAAIADALVELEVLDGVDARPDLTRFSRALVSALDRPAPPTGRLSSGIIVGPLDAATGLELDLAVVLGCVEGELPRRAHASAVLSTEERETVGLEAATPGKAVERDRRLLFVALSGAARTVLTRRDRDSRDGRARIRSRFVGRDTPTRRVASSVGALESVAVGSVPAIGEGEVVSAAFIATSASRHDQVVSFLVAASPHLASGSRAAAARGARSFGRFAGRLEDGAGADGLVGSVLSPTTLEEFAVCPFRYFLGHELRCEVIDAPERRTEIDPRDRGQIAHEVLERYMREVIGLPQTNDLDPAGAAARLWDIATEVCDRYERLGRTGKRILWMRTRRELLDKLEAERARDAESRQRRGAKPITVEWSFGTSAAPPVDFTVGDRKLSFRGKIDRVDRRSDGALDVIDYKTGKAASYKGIVVDPVDGGRHLQLPIYALAARAALVSDEPGVPVRASYRFVDEPDEEVAIELDGGTIARTQEVLSVLAGTVESGCFPFRPGARQQESFEHCRWCDFDTICPVERDVLWRVARAAPVLTSYVNLVEPETTDE
ncbi:MAG TPA: PD-(D/E)XK nuclease family protein [Acidimicrobiales bacterium]|nr:PD-(D/E)XK nuclease family protein [Acidimicrobiales bacterium]